MLLRKGEDILQSIRYLGCGNDRTPDKRIFLPDYPGRNAAAGGDCLERSKSRNSPAKGISVETDIRSIRLEINHFFPIELLLAMRGRDIIDLVHCFVLFLSATLMTFKSTS